MRWAWFQTLNSKFYLEDKSVSREKQLNRKNWIKIKRSIQSKYIRRGREDKRTERKEEKEADRKKLDDEDEEDSDEENKIEGAKEKVDLKTKVKQAAFNKSGVKPNNK